MRPLIHLLILASLLTGSPQLIAQNTAQSETIPLTKELLLNYLATEKVVTAGVGFQIGEIGDPIESILKTWGPPLRHKKSEHSGAVALYYQPDPNTVVRFTGKEVIEKIVIKGNPASLLRTGRGARFGMQAIHVLRIYSRWAERIEGNRIEYNKHGISFLFTNRRLSEINIYFPVIKEITTDGR